MRFKRTTVRAKVLRLAALIVTASCSAEGPTPDNEGSAYLQLEAAYSPGYGVALEPGSAEKLRDQMRPGERLGVIVGGRSQPLESADWQTALDAADLGPFALQAEGGAEPRPLGELRVIAHAAPTCDPSNDAEESAPSAPFSASQAEDVASSAQGLAAACSHGAYYWYCINCQCRSGIRVLGWKRRYICIYGAQYPENVYSCSCGFTSRLCGVDT